jgi:hypothetical protein
MNSDSKDLEVGLIISKDSETMTIARQTDDGIQVGTARVVRDGEPTSSESEIVRVTPTKGTSLCTIETLREPQGASSRRKSGPCTAATDQYRRNWDGVFNKNKDKHELN